MYARYIIALGIRTIDTSWKRLRWILAAMVIAYALWMLAGQIAYGCRLRSEHRTTHYSSHR